MLFFVNEPDPQHRLLSIPISPTIVNGAVDWTLEQVKELRDTVLRMQQDPLSIEGGDLRLVDQPPAQRVTEELKQQCTACGQRFDCTAYGAALTSGSARRTPADIDLLNVGKN